MSIKLGTKTSEDSHTVINASHLNIVYCPLVVDSLMKYVGDYTREILEYGARQTAQGLSTPSTRRDEVHVTLEFPNIEATLRPNTTAVKIAASELQIAHIAHLGQTTCDFSEQITAKIIAGFHGASWPLFQISVFKPPIMADRPAITATIPPKEMSSGQSVELSMVLGARVAYWDVSEFPDVWSGYHIPCKTFFEFPSLKLDAQLTETVTVTAVCAAEQSGELALAVGDVVVVTDNDVDPMLWKGYKQSDTSKAVGTFLHSHTATNGKTSLRIESHFMAEGSYVVGPSTTKTKRVVVKLADDDKALPESVHFKVDPVDSLTDQFTFQGELLLLLFRMLMLFRSPVCYCHVDSFGGTL
jgi:hypothetical protein